MLERELGWEARLVGTSVTIGLRANINQNSVWVVVKLGLLLTFSNLSESFTPFVTSIIVFPNNLNSTRNVGKCHAPTPMVSNMPTHAVLTRISTYRTRAKDGTLNARQDM